MITDVNKILIKPASGLIAHNPVLCTPRDENFSRTRDLYFSYANNYLVCSNLAFVLELQLFFGLRVSECLNVNREDIISSDTIRLRTLKGGNNRLIKLRYNDHFLKESYVNRLPLKNLLNRYYIYRTYKKLGIYKRYDNRLYDSVTHYFRHELVQNLKSKGVDNETISQYMGWKGEKTILYYL